ncbi:ABC transporter ATP-binding protein [Streptomyces sp. NPDC053048]|uniref:ABC transporter ATP-binding protein n=1 Tax=Streptomyces sp. NPDC053048 TaxID=3365694 RepID=UPI0037D2097E
MSSAGLGTSDLRAYLLLLREQLAPQRRRFLLLCVLLLSETVLLVSQPQFLRYFIDGALGEAAERTLLVLGGCYLATALAGQAASMAAQHCAVSVARDSGDRLRARLVDHCLRLDADYHRRHPPGELLDRIDGDVTKLAGFLSRMALDVVAQLLLMVCVLAALCVLDWRLGLLYLPLWAAALPLLARGFGRATPQLEAGRQAGTDLLGWLEERLSATEDIRANGAVPYVLRDLGERLTAYRRAAARAARAAVSWPMSVQALSQLAFALALALGAWLHQRRELSAGDVLASLSYVMLLRQPLVRITQQLGEFEEAVVSLRRIRRLLACCPRLTDGTGELRVGPVPVEFDRVSFGYAGGPRVLADVSFELPAGRQLGVVGRTGCGKSTLIRLLFRFHDPDEGVVRLGGHDARSLRLGSLRGKVALVTQEVHILEGTLRENLVLFDPGADDRRVLRALDNVGLTPWYETLPEGLDTPLGGAGIGLSAGQAQLVALVRAWVRDPGLVLLDEFSSRLDPHSERLLQTALRRFLADRTAVVVAHRLQTLREVDRILVLGENGPLEYGAREELIADPRSELSRLLRVGEVIW